MDTEEIGFLWISEILGSEYPEEEQYLMASEVVRVLERCSPIVEPTWVPSLLKFLSLCDNFPTTKSPPHPGLDTLRILFACPRDAGFGASLLPTLTSMLSPDHPLRSRKFALAVFCKFTRGWFSRMEAVSGHRLNKFLQAVGDPFRFPPEPPRFERTVDYEPMDVVVALIEFASSELWRSLLRPSNFISCEDVLSTDEGRSSALRRMFWTALGQWPEFLCTPTKIVSAVQCLEEFGCLNTARVVITWAWVTGMADAMDQDGWKLIGGETLRFYRAHGMRSLAALKLCITRNFKEDGGVGFNRVHLFAAHYEGPPFRVGRSRRPSNISYFTEGGIPSQEEWMADCVISQACQLRRLYHLFGYDPTTWQEIVGAGGADEKREVLSRHPVTPDPFVGWECDYP